MKQKFGLLKYCLGSHIIHSLYNLESRKQNQTGKMFERKFPFPSISECQWLLIVISMFEIIYIFNKHLLVSEKHAHTFILHVLGRSILTFNCSGKLSSWNFFLISILSFTFDCTNNIPYTHRIIIYKGYAESNLQWAVKIIKNKGEQFYDAQKLHIIQ